MNAIAEFERTIASQHFNSYKNLSDSLTAFSGTYGYRFNNAKFSYFDEGTAHRELFVYKYLDLKCVYAKKRGCTACCNVRCRRNFLYIRAWSMEHNHPPDPPDTSTLADCTDAFKETFSNSMLFDSLVDFEAKIRELEEITGTKFTKYSSRMLPETSEYRERLVYERVNYGCIHSGKTKQRGSSEQMGVRSQKIGCQARIRACIAKDKLKVMLYSMKHNHMVSNGRGNGLLRGVAKLAIQFSDGSTLTLDDDEAGGGERRDNDGFRRVSRPGNEDEEDAEVDFELDLPNLAATAANGFRDDDLPAMPIVLKKTRSSAAGAARTNAGRRAKRVRRHPRTQVDDDVNYIYGDFAESHSLDVYEDRLNYLPLPDIKPAMPRFYADNLGPGEQYDDEEFQEYRRANDEGTVSGPAEDSPAHENNQYKIPRQKSLRKPKPSPELYCSAAKESSAAEEESCDGQ